MADLLTVKDLKVSFRTDGGIIPAVDGVSFSMRRGEIHSLVGESGCGKSVTALSLLRLIPNPPGRIEGGAVRWQGERDLLAEPLPEIVRLRGQAIGLIFQEPLTSFNPVQRIGEQIAEVLQIHSGATKVESRERVLAMLARVGLPDPLRQYQAYPHELSGGMRQRAMIAMALIGRPDLLIADEPTTALDVTIQAQIMELIRELQAEFQMSVLLITHNLGLVAETAQQVSVMYCGKIVEQAPVHDLFKKPLHPYTQGLLDSVPQITDDGELRAIPGMIPDPLQLPAGCYFEPRCGRAREICRRQYPPESVQDGCHRVSCWLYE
ncbi:peptide/nickel transport system ATP-binding protein/oligopeptide transport system ATP-binding protein [Hydrogenispora ethanolica]|uniref:Peptide/nickel transport system ATP-binding protein/oligopeptide transport system ATP-binding protein n=1 Tax=Hydrogenispora ethanolica TaxID=1082276 RepID=A0A4R1QV49_HYDET|nr:ABC transporter ATP-binding protein [Hydrogenispora ethanolica]TCL57103.1 peptide/nickel transport system ATP-binding protein/oligopeptide transport system ATP-binding protein [Hydrogenispora ethanolica]